MAGNLNHNIAEIKTLERSVKSHVGIAAAVTSYAEIEMIKYKTLPGYNIYYSDTDSIFVDKHLPEHMVGPKV